MKLYGAQKGNYFLDIVFHPEGKGDGVFQVDKTVVPFRYMELSKVQSHK